MNELKMKNTRKQYNKEHYKNLTIALPIETYEEFDNYIKYRNHCFITKRSIVIELIKKYLLDHK